MKKICFMVALAALTAFAACEKYEDGKPGKHTRDEFATMYPSAKDVEWDYEQGYWVVSFETGMRPDVKEHEAWYDASGNWVMTKTDVLLTDVPQNIKDALAADPVYGKAPFEDYDADYVQTPSGEFYRFDILMGGREVYVDVSADGTVTLASFPF